MHIVVNKTVKNPSLYRSLEMLMLSVVYVIWRKSDMVEFRVISQDTLLYVMITYFNNFKNQDNAVCLMIKLNIKWDLFQGYKDDSIFENQSPCYIP